MVRARAMIYKVVVQTMLLYRIKIWLVMEAMLKVLEGLHQRLDHRIAGMSDRRVGEYEWK